MEIQEGIKLLVEKYSTNDWYDSVGLDKYGRYVVYVTTMNYEVMTTVQQSLEGKQVLINYASSKPENLKKYSVSYDWNRPAVNKEIPFDPFARDPRVGELSLEDLTKLQAPAAPPIKYVDDIDIINLDELIAELDRLERVCGSHGLQDIFYEVHDGKNAVTNLGSKYPDVKRDMHRLYDRYGFDIIYEELDG